MNGYNFEAIGAAIITCFVASALYYSLFSDRGKELSLIPNPDAKKHRTHPKLLVAEILRNTVLALALAYLINQLHVNTTLDALWLSLLLWAAFPVMILTGSVLYEKFPFKLALVHMGDWALKLPLMILIMTLWR
jgi:hypothetical protein